MPTIMPMNMPIIMPMICIIMPMPTPLQHRRRHCDPRHLDNIVPYPVREDWRLRHRCSDKRRRPASYYDYYYAYDYAYYYA